MSDMVERVARALALHDYGTEDVWESHVSSSRAAIEAMNMPPRYMWLAGEMALPVDNPRPLDAAHVWNAMVAAALRHEPPAQPDDNELASTPGSMR